MLLPRFYPILDAGLSKQAGQDVFQIASVIFHAGARLAQYRNKQDSSRVMLGEARKLRDLSESLRVRLRFIMNDRADLCVAADFDGVHVGQDDLSPEGARKVIGNGRLLGVSCHNPEQVLLAPSPRDPHQLAPHHLVRHRYEGRNLWSVAALSDQTLHWLSNNMGALRSAHKEGRPVLEIGEM